MNECNGRWGKRNWLLGLLLLLILCACEYRPRYKRPLPDIPRVEPLSAAPEAPPAAAPDAAPMAAPAGPTNLAGYIVSARASSSQNPQSVPQLAFDGNPATRWSSEFRDGEWIEGWFDRTVQVARIEVHWEKARAADFALSIRNRKGDWVRIAQRRDAVGPLDDVDFSVPLPALAIRVECDRRATAWGSSIFEIKAFGLAEGPPPTNSLLGFEVEPSELQKTERATAQRLLAAAKTDPPTAVGLSDDAFLNLIARRAFDYFWYETNPTNGLTRDRGRAFGSSEDCNVASVAAVGYALSAYVIGAERGWIDRAAALERSRITLRTFDAGPIRNLRGFFPHFVDMFTAKEALNTEISTIDTALFLAGMITALEYFDDPELRDRARRIFERVDWAWARNGHPHFVTHGTRSDGAFLDARWGTATEGLLIYLLALGSPTHPLPPAAWFAIDRHTGEYEGYKFVAEYGFQSIFRYQYPALWYDFRGRTDRTNLDYFENATIATLAMRLYCIRKAAEYPASYGPQLWGLGAADGPGDQYMIYGFPPGDPYSPVDGTVIPYASAGSINFLPQHTLPCLRKLYDEHHAAWGKYGFTDAINPTTGFIARDCIGLDQGTILLAIENYRSGLIWKLFMRNPWIRKTSQQIGWKTRRLPSDPGGPLDLARQGIWRFKTGNDDYSAPALDDALWAIVPVPDMWEHYGESCANFDGAAWYRCAFELNAARLDAWSKSNQPITLRFGGADDCEISYVNGFKVGESRPDVEVYRAPRRYEVPLNILHAGRNVVAIHVFDQRGAGGLWYPPVEIGPAE